MVARLLVYLKPAFLCLAAAGLLSACDSEPSCVVVDNLEVHSAINEALRPSVEYYVKEDDYVHTLEQEMSQTDRMYLDCGSYYKVDFTPSSGDAGLVAIGSTVIYKVSKRTMKVTSIRYE